MNLQPPTIILLLIFAYLYFWFQAVHVNGPIRILKYGSWDAEEETLQAPPLKPLHPMALAWATGLLILLLTPKGTCSVNPTRPFSMEMALLVLTIILSGKVLLSPASVSFTSVQRQKDGSVKSTLFTKAFDFATSGVVKGVETVILKLTLIAFFSGIVWLLGWQSKSAAIPDGVFFAWAVYEISRGLMVASVVPLPGFLKFKMLLIYLASLFAVWVVIENALQACGVQPGVLPSWGTVIGSLAVIPAIKSIVAAVSLSCILLISG